MPLVPNVPLSDVNFVWIQPHLGDVLKNYREGRGLTTAEAAAELHTTKVYYEGWEAGKDMKLSTAKKLTAWMRSPINVGL